MLELLTKMEWPFAFAVIGIAWAVAVPLIVRRNLDRAEKIEEIKLKRAVQLESFKKGALTYVEEHN